MAISEVYATNGDNTMAKPAGVSEVFITNMPEGGGSGGVTSVNGQTGDVNITLSSLNTAGITDVQMVNELPASPVSTVLYLIPEV